MIHKVEIFLLRAEDARKGTVLMDGRRAPNPELGVTQQLTDDKQANIVD